MARIRNTEYNTVHHLTSRIAHRAFFLNEEERNRFIDLMLRVSAFSGLELIGWCVLDNHFHIYVYLPVPPELSDEDVLRRYKLLKGDAHRLVGDEDDDRIVNPYAKVGAECPTPRANSDGRAEARMALVKSIRRRLYSVAEYMRMIKKWFSDGYNERSCHKGTMWEAIYGDNTTFLPDSPDGYADIRDILAYIHLNPIRAAVTDHFDGYEWSSYTAYRRGDAVASAAMHRAYPGCSDEEIVERHELRMGRLLEVWKRRRAEEIAQKRMAGYEIPADRVTDECMIAQAQARIEQIHREVIELQLARKLVKGEKESRRLVCEQIVKLISVYPRSTAKSLGEQLCVPLRTMQRYMSSLAESGVMRLCFNGWQVRPARPESRVAA